MIIEAGDYGFPKIRGTILGVPILRTIVYWGLHWGPLILGNYHYEGDNVEPENDFSEGPALQIHMLRHTLGGRPTQ